MRPELLYVTKHVTRSVLDIKTTDDGFDICGQIDSVLMNGKPIRVMQKHGWYFASIDEGNGFVEQTLPMTGHELKKYILEKSH